MVVGPRDQACSRTLVPRHNRCADVPKKRHILVSPARYPRVRSGLIYEHTAKGADMETIRSPATEELVGSVAKGGREHADAAVAAAKAAHADGRWRRTPPAKRAAMLDAIADGLTERVNDLAVLEALENGAPVQLEAGTVWVNDWHMVNAAYPFGGYKQSGLGRQLGPHALDEYTEEKFVHIDLSGRLDRRAFPLLLSTPPS
jgi:acyl-CoA reductase-like NAD-dependent aldehyde dehydrogenase